jgi:hypothetical protein
MTRQSTPYFAMLLVAFGLPLVLRCTGGASSSNNAPQAPDANPPDSTVTATATASTTATTTDTAASEEGDEGSTDTGDASSLTLVHAFPEGLALAVLPTVVPASLPESLPAVSGATTVDAGDEETALELQAPPTQEVTAAPQTISEKVEAAQAKLLAAGPCVDAALFDAVSAPLPSCYTPDTDLDFVPEARDGQGNVTTPASLKPTPTDAAHGEACLAAYARAKLASTVALVDRATGLAVAMICQATLAGQDELPPQGAFVELKETLGEALVNIAGVTVEEAKITRNEDQDGRPVFLTEITIERDVGSGKTQLDEIKVLHSPGPDGNIAYNGRLWMRSGTHDPNAPQAQGGGGPTPATMTYLAIDYARGGSASEPRIQYKLLQGQYVQDAATQEPYDIVLPVAPFDGQGHLDLNAGADFDKPEFDGLYGAFPSDSAQNLNSTLGGSQLVALDVNPLTNAGKLVYWQNYGGNYHESARGMIFNLEPGDGNALAGCAVSGAAGANGPNAAVSIRKALVDGLAFLTPGGYYHPGTQTQSPAPLGSTQEQLEADPSYVCDEGLCQFGPYVYRQCFAQSADGHFLPAPSRMAGALYQRLHMSDPNVTAIEAPEYASIPSLEL